MHDDVDDYDEEEDNDDDDYDYDYDDDDDDADDDDDDYDNDKFRITMCSSIFLLMGTAVERYLAVCRPHHYRTVTFWMMMIMMRMMEKQ